LYDKGYYNFLCVFYDECNIFLGSPACVTLAFGTKAQYWRRCC